MTTETEPPMPGAWGGRPAYYRVELEKFERLTDPLPLSLFEAEFADLIQRELERRPPQYLFTRYGDHFRVSQGTYMSKVTPNVSNALEVAFDDFNVAAVRAQQPEISMREYREGERQEAERRYFRRNAALRRDALDHYGDRCFACNLRLEDTYGAVGSGVIDFHHLDPLAGLLATDQADRISTVEDVRPLCPNCHRIAHARRPPYDMEELRELIEARRAGHIAPESA